ncbi:hypothetical protein HT118_26590, partial [Escherichia coli]|nr:hypothetical protein [Escherichia coli]
MPVCPRRGKRPRAGGAERGPRSRAAPFHYADVLMGGFCFFMPVICLLLMLLFLLLFFFFPAALILTTAVLSRLPGA